MARKKAEIIPIIHKWEMAHMNLHNLNEKAGDGTGYVFGTFQHVEDDAPQVSFSHNYAGATRKLRREVASCLRAIAIAIEDGNA